ncbi:MAG: nucleotidyltransferase family protein [Proteobacteria bacterium]|nr:nucleotidyltransferase family protein [Pseudomonadota bacterium]
MELFDEFSQLVSEFKKENIEYALCGGLAMAVYAFPRATLDIDISIEPQTLEKAKTIAKRLGFTFDAGLMKSSDGAVQIYRLTKITLDSSDTLMLDMLLLTPEIKEVWESKQILTWDQGDLPVVSPKGLIKLKSMRLSGQDQDDIKNLESILDED